MAGSLAVLEDSSTLSRLDRTLYRLETMLAVLSGLAVFCLMLLAVGSVSGRNLMNSPLPGYVDWIEVAMPLIAFMGIAMTQRDGGHIRMDIVVGALKGRLLWLAEWLTTAVVLIFVVLLIWGSWAHFERSFDWAAPMWSRDSTIDIGLPLWPAKLLAPVALSVLALRLALQLWGFGRAFVRGEERPVAVPMIASVAEIAAEEAAYITENEAGK